MDTGLTVRPLLSVEEAEHCARMMAESEPWITLGRSFEAGLAMLQDPFRERYLALLGSEITGFLVLMTRGALVGYIQTICVAPAFRRSGIGTKLVAFAEERIFADFPNVFMCVSSFNVRAQRLYERLGYEQIARLDDYIVPGHAELLLRKRRTPSP